MKTETAFLTALFVLSIFCFTASCDDDDDDNDGVFNPFGDDDNDEDDDSDDEDDDGNDDFDDYDPVGNCETKDEYDAIKWMFVDCYELQDSEGNVMDAVDVCEFSTQDDIECFMTCYDAVDYCRGEYDPLFDCLGYNCGLAR